MSSCMAPVPQVFEIGGVCYGHGACVNSSRNPGLLLCKCDTWYSGASDLFDNRVELLADGSYLSFSCTNSLAGIYVIWGFCLFLCIVRLKQLAPVWIQFYRRHYADPRKVEQGFFHDAALRILSYDLIITIPLLITAICKLTGMTIGTDISLTVFYCISAVGMQISLFEVGRTEFGIFILGTSNAAEGKKATRFRLVIKLLGLFLYFMLTVCPMLASLETDKTQGPLINGEMLVIFFRNAGAICFGVTDIWATWMIRSRVKKLMLQSKSSDSAVSRIIEKMDKEMNTYIKFLCLFVPMFIVMSLPFLLPFQTYILALMMGTPALRHSAKAFSDDKEAGKERGGTVSSLSRREATETEKPPKTKSRSASQLGHNTTPADSRSSVAVAEVGDSVA